MTTIKNQELFDSFSEAYPNLTSTILADQEKEAEDRQDANEAFAIRLSDVARSADLASKG